MNIDQKPELLTTNEVAKLLRVTSNTIHTMRRDGRLPGIKLGGVVRYRKDDVQRILGLKSGDAA